MCDKDTLASICQNRVSPALMQKEGHCNSAQQLVVSLFQAGKCQVAADNPSEPYQGLGTAAQANPRPMLPVSNTGALMLPTKEITPLLRILENPHAEPWPP